VLEPKERRLRARTEVARQRYGRHPKTLERWEADPALGFPKSRLIRKRHYYFEDELDDYDRRLAGVGQ
jgi:hypothetical protein